MSEADSQEVSLVERIAYAGLEHWCEGHGELAPELSQLAMDLAWSGERVRGVSQSAVCGVTDPRWLEVILTTCISASFTLRTLQGTDDILSFIKIESWACRRKHGCLDGFTALADDPIWIKVSPPFDWLCSCTLLSVSAYDVSRRSQGRQAALPRLSGKRLQLVQPAWVINTPESAFDLI